ncbi:xanthine dehydrogenase accessory factor [Desulfotomaculum arcticum]|uniref:Xanthine dehydrogenase accessory factor n=1 Tax=Desulfotruncus arcticus DSM 17038 TaxID=1121424 RepID=A0A1I2S519_9FIRM|nr:selenium-dependent molybdenum cofactor biosynthesis protein YqeB [Desulfotruncus arcticus]SFG47413.1 xanthine dehydrogenase accessory factor [Desulfotomaculum arcticum] [Desulfotruncus arcticus DSM 17038]
MNEPEFVIIKGAGDLASGVAYVLKSEGYNVIMTEIEKPTCVRRKVSFAEAVYEGKIYVQGICGKLAKNVEEVSEILLKGDIAVIVDPCFEVRKDLSPSILIDATMAKVNLGTKRSEANIVIALGPGFEAGIDAHAVIETHRDANPGTPIFSGTATPNTGIPGSVLGYKIERLLRSPVEGTFKPKLEIGDYVEKGDTVATVNGLPVKALIGGVVRGLIKSGLPVYKNMKVGDIHPEKNKNVCYVITDKALAVGKGVLSALQILKEQTIA